MYNIFKIELAFVRVIFKNIRNLYFNYGKKNNLVIFNRTPPISFHGLFGKNIVAAVDDVQASFYLLVIACRLICQSYNI